MDYSQQPNDGYRDVPIVPGYVCQCAGDPGNGIQYSALLPGSNVGWLLAEKPPYYVLFQCYDLGGTASQPVKIIPAPSDQVTCGPGYAKITLPGGYAYCRQVNQPAATNTAVVCDTGVNVTPDGNKCEGAVPGYPYGPPTLEICARYGLTCPTNAPYSNPYSQPINTPITPTYSPFTDPNIQISPTGVTATTPPQTTQPITQAPAPIPVNTNPDSPVVAIATHPNVNPVIPVVNVPVTTNPAPASSPLGSLTSNPTILIAAGVVAFLLLKK